MDLSEKIYELEARVAALEFLLKLCLANQIRAAADRADDAVAAGIMFAGRLFPAEGSVSIDRSDPNVAIHVDAIARSQVERIVRELLHELGIE